MAFGGFTLAIGFKPLSPAATLIPILRRKNSVQEKEATVGEKPSFDWLLMVTSKVDEAY